MINKQITFDRDGALTCDVVRKKLKCYNISDPANNEEYITKFVRGDFLEVWPSAVNIHLETSRESLDENAEHILVANSGGKFDIGVVKGTKCILDSDTIECKLERSSPRPFIA